MTKTRSKRKTRFDKFPLTLHPTGQYCKKIRGKLHYFGANKQEALRRYLEQASYLHAGKLPEAREANDSVCLKTLCNLCIGHQHLRVQAGEIKLRQVYDQTTLLWDFALYMGPNRKDVNKQNEVVNNHIHHCGQIHRRSRWE